MDIELERNQIIEELYNVTDELVLRAIRRLLGLGESDISEEHKCILDGRIDAFELGKAKTMSWDEVKKRIYKHQ
jgi:hypothetical protein